MNDGWCTLLATDITVGYIFIVLFFAFQVGSRDESDPRHQTRAVPASACRHQELPRQEQAGQDHCPVDSQY